MRGEAYRWFVRGTGLAVGVLLVYVIASGIALAGKVLFLVFIAVLLASALEPLVGYLRARLPFGRVPTILIVYLGFFIVVIALAALVVPGALNQVNTLTTRLPPFLDQARASAAQITPRALSTSLTALIDAARDAIRVKPPEPGKIVEAGLGVAEVVVSIVTLLALVFFWLTEHARLQRYALAFVPAERRAGTREAWNEVETRLGSWVRGQLILMGTVAIATTIAYTVLGLESPILLGVLAGIAESIPIVGPLIGAIPALIVGATMGPQTMLLVAGVYLVIQFVEGNVLVPLVMRNTIGISPFLVITSLLVGSAVGGIPGAFLAVPLVAAIEVILERLQARDSPIAQDPASSSSPDEGARDEAKKSIPDSAAPQQLR